MSIRLGTNRPRFFSCLGSSLWGSKPQANKDVCELQVIAKQCTLINLPVRHLTRVDEETILKRSNICFAKSGCQPAQSCLSHSDLVVPRDRFPPSRWCSHSSKYCFLSRKPVTSLQTIWSTARVRMVR